MERVGELPDYMEPISIGIPADLLMRRPDIRSAEHQINAQAASLGASKSDWLPQVFIKGSVGYASKDFKDLTKHKSFTYEIAPALSWTIFSGGKLVNATKSARAQLDEAIDQFNQTVLTAVQETDNAMTAYRSSIKQIVALREVRNQGQETLTLSLDLYKQGLTPFQNVLDAQRSLLSYENQLVQARGNSLLQLIALYQALGVAGTTKITKPTITMKKLLYILLALPLLTACREKKETAGAAASTHRRQRSQPLIKDITLTKDYPGYLTTEQTVNLVARVNGTLQSTSFTPGAGLRKDSCFSLSNLPSIKTM